MPDDNPKLNDVDVDSALKNLSRIEALLRTGLVDRPPRADLDSLTREVSERVGGLKAQVTVVDDHRQIFVSTFGDSGAVDEEPLSYSYCKYVVAMDDVLAVQDSATDPLVRNNLSTTIKGLRAYLGVPLHSQGQTIGSLCVFDEKPRQWTADDLNDLYEIAGLVEEHIENQLIEESGS